MCLRAAGVRSGVTTSKIGGPAFELQAYNEEQVMVRVVIPITILLAGTAAHAERLVFTTMTHVSCPVRIEAPKESKDYGFHPSSSATIPTRSLASCTSR